MKELDFYRFINSNAIEYRREGDELLVWIKSYHLEDFTKMIDSYLDDGGVDCRLQSYGTICLDIAPVCDYFGIEVDRIFELPKAIEQ